MDINTLKKALHEGVVLFEFVKKAWRSMRIDTLWNWHRAMKLV